MTLMTIELRHVVEGDLPTFFEQQRDPEANRLAAFPPREREAFMQHWEKILRNDSGVVRAIIADGTLAGNIVAWQDGDQRKIGYWIGKQFWGKGIASAALRQFLRIVEERPLYAHVARHNAGSIRVLEKCGFHVNGEETVLSEDGEEIPELVMVLGEP